MTKPTAGFLQSLGYVHETEVAGTGCSVRTLRRMAKRGQGPARVKFNNRWYYSVENFRKWLEAKSESPNPTTRRRRRSA